MKEKIMNTFTHLILPLFLGVIVVIIVFAALESKTLLMLSTPRAFLIALLVVGLTICFLGGVGQIGTTGRWDSPPAIVGSLLGFVILVIIISALVGWRLPLIPGELQAIKTVGILMGIKFLIGIASFFFNWL